MNIVTIRIPKQITFEDLERIERRIEKKLKDGGCADFIVVAVPEGADISVMRV